MKTLYVVCQNHMDPVWKRCFDISNEGPDVTTRPYADIEERQVDAWMGLAEECGVRYSLEQSITMKMYLARRPDEFARVKKCLADGSLDLMGGGETVIDYNMVCGESIVRNHLYSILYYQNTFGLRPTIGIVPDTFGLSAQLPQIFRKLGYSTILKIVRVFRDRKPFWQGLDSHIVYMGATDAERDVCVAAISETMPNMPSKCCSGKGCRACDFTGLDASVQLPSHDALSRALDRIASSEAATGILSLTSEEALPDRRVIEGIEQAAQARGMNVEFVSYSQLVEKIDHAYIGKVHKGTVAQEEIDSRVEGNPIGTGCYVSRVELKRYNRRLEDLLLAAEKFSALSSGMGGVYPRKRLETLWNKMALLQFHDSITGSHDDKSYEDLIRRCREIECAGFDLYRATMRKVSARIRPAGRHGTSAVVFNPLSWPVGNAVAEIVIDTPDPELFRHVEASDSRGNAIPVLSVTPLSHMREAKLAVRVLAPELPPVGYGSVALTVGWGAPKEPSFEQVVDTAQAENQYYRIDLDRKGIVGVFDKRTEGFVAGRGTGSLVAEEDHGSPWETLATPYCPIELIGRASVARSKNGWIIRIGGDLDSLRAQRDQGMHRITWQQEITLLDTMDRIDFRTTIDWDTENVRIIARFPLGFRPANDEAWYSVPFGVLKRAAYEPRYGVHMNPDGNWPALDFVACQNVNENYTVAVFNRGLHANRVKDGSIKLSLVRSPQIPVYCGDLAKAAEKGVHVFEYAFSSGPGDLAANRIVQRGIEFNTVFYSIEGAPKPASDASLPQEHSFMSNECENVVISSVKLAENSDDLVVRGYDAYGLGGTDKIHGVQCASASVTDLLEQPEAPVGTDVSYKPFEIKTVRFSGWRLPG